MQKYAIYIVKENNKKLISIHEEKAEALECGQQIYDELPGKAGIVSCLAEEFDCKNNRVGRKSCVHKVWM